MNDNKTNINWFITINLNPFGTPYKIKKNQNSILHVLYKYMIKIYKN